MSAANQSESPPNIKKKRENIVAKYLYRPLSEPIAIFLARFGVSPNSVTTFSIFLSIISGGLFTPGELGYSLLGALFLQLAVLADHVDGSLARYTNKQSLLGHWWDGMANKQIKFFVLLGMSYGAYRQIGQPLMLLAGSVAIFNVTYSAFIVQMKRDVPGAAEKSLMPETEKTFFPASLILYAIITLGGLTNQLWFPLLFFSTFGFIWIKQIRNIFKSAR